jgi:hypothetical protein
MKYTIEGFSQELLVEYGLDAVDALILRWFIDFQPKMIKINNDGKDYSWVKYQAIIDDLPILGITNREVISRRFNKFIDAGIMEKFLCKDGGVFTSFRLTNKYLNLVDGSTRKSKGVDSTVDNCVYSEVETKDSSIKINSSITYIEENNNLFDEINFNENERLKKTTDEIFKHWERIAKELNIKFTDNEWDTIYGYVQTKLNLPPHLIKGAIMQLDKWANEGLDIIDALLKGFATRTLYKPFMVIKQDARGNRLNREALIALRNKQIYEETKGK